MFASNLLKGMIITSLTPDVFISSVVWRHGMVANFSHLMLDP